MLISRISTRSGVTSAPPSQSILISKIHPSLASRSSKSMGTAYNIPSTPILEWTDLGRSRFLRHCRQFHKPTSWMDYQTPRSPPTPSPTSDCTCDSPDSLKPTGLRTLWSKGKNSPSLASSTASCQPRPHPLTKRPLTFPTWLSWGSYSAYVKASAPSALSITELLSYVHSCN